MQAVRVSSHITHVWIPGVSFVRVSTVDLHGFTKVLSLLVSKRVLMSFKVYIKSSQEVCSPSAQHLPSLQF